MPRGIQAIESIGVAGAGTMGSGIAQVAAMNDFHVQMYDIEAEYVESGFDRITNSLDRFVRNETMGETETDHVRNRIEGTTDLESFATCDFVVEAAPESDSIKRELFEHLDRITDPDVILASNTSTLSITGIASVTNRSPLVIGMHFMNPAPVMEGVEIVVGELTDSETVSITTDLADRLGKTTWQSDDKPGFVVNRILMPWINEGIRALDEGIASRDDIDSGMKLGTGVPMGPLELADYVGLDIVLNASETLHRELGDRYQPAYLLKRKVAAGHLGRKTGTGFYRYR